MLNPSPKVLMFARSAPCRVLLGVGLLGVGPLGCAPSIRQAHESNRYFERCHTAEESLETSEALVDQCWTRWLDHYSANQPPEKIAFAKARAERASKKVASAGASEPAVNPAPDHATDSPEPLVRPGVRPCRGSCDSSYDTCAEACVVKSAACLNACESERITCIRGCP